MVILIEFIVFWIVGPLICGFLFIGFMACSWMLLNYLEENKFHPLSRMLENPYGIIILIWAAGLFVYSILGYFDTETNQTVIFEKF